MLVVIEGGMFSEKSTELQRRGKRLIRAGKEVIYYKPNFDNRYSTDEIVTHDGTRVPCQNLHENPLDLLNTDYSDVDAILIDEIQFLNENIVRIISTLFKRYPHLTIIVAGLDMDYQGNVFTNTAFLAATAEEVVKLHAVCAGCGDDAWITARTVDNGEQIELGSDELYYPLCRTCFNHGVPHA